jgi:cytochrome c553
LRVYRSGDRENPIMSPIAKGIAQEDLRKIAAYFAVKG